MYVNNRKFGRQNIIIDVTMNLHYSFVIIKCKIYCKTVAQVIQSVYYYSVMGHAVNIDLKKNQGKHSRHPLNRRLVGPSASLDPVEERQFIFIYAVHSPTIALLGNLVKSFKFTIKYTINVNFKTFN